MNNKSKRPYSTPSRTINTKGVRKGTKSSATDRVMKTASARNNRKNNTPSRVNKVAKKIESSKKEKVTPKKSSPKVAKLEQTTRIRIDQDRINDYETLDTSFLEGRTVQGTAKNKSKEKVLNREDKNDRSGFLVIFKVLGALCIMVLVVLASIVFIKNRVVPKTKPINKKTEISEKDKVNEKVEPVIDDNYLFVGDFNIKELNLSEKDFHYVKSSEEKYTTNKVLDNMKNYIYKYNPSMVFIELGIIDLSDGKSVSEVAQNISKIIDGIKENRPLSKIYIESIYPINKDVDDYNKELVSLDVSYNDILEVNLKLKEIALKKKVNYIDLYDLLSEENKLKKKYTDDGVKLNDEGYAVVFKEINGIIGEWFKCWISLGVMEKV